MKILFLTHRLPYAPNRGDRIRAYYLLQEMSKFAQVSVFSLVHDDEEAAQVGRVQFAHDVTTVRVTRLRNLIRGAARLASRRPLTHSLLDAPDAHAALVRMVSANPPDLVLAFCSGMARLALEPPLDRYPLVIDMVDVDSKKWSQLAAQASGPRRWIYQREASTLGAFEATATDRARMTLVVNGREREALLELAPKARTAVIECGVDIDAFAPPSPPMPDPTVVFCGVLNYGPNEDGVRWFAQDVWPRVRAVMPAARFIVVGTGATATIKALAADDPSIEVVGRVEAVQPYLWRSAVSVAPLRVARGMQTKVLEAVAAGLPTVVTPAVWAGLPPEAQAACLSAEQPQEFSEALLQLLRKSPEERRGLASRAQIGKLGWANRLESLERTLTEACLTQPAR